MAKKSGALVLQRRREVADLWLHGVPVPEIARHLSVPERTIWRDVAAIRAELVEANRATLEERRARSTAVLREVQLMARSVFNDPNLNPNSTSRIGAVNSIRDAEIAIAKLEGTWRVDAQRPEAQEPSFRTVFIYPQLIDDATPPDLLPYPPESPQDVSQAHMPEDTLDEDEDPLGWPEPEPPVESDEF